MLGGKWHLLCGGTVVCALLGLALVGPSNAQTGQLAGSTDGSYCKFRKKDRIEVDTWLPMDRSEAFAYHMTLRRLAAMARSKDFSAILLDTRTTCGTLLVDGSMRGRRCRLQAVMTNAPVASQHSETGSIWMAVERIFADTSGEVSSYPIRTGLLNHGNQCVLD